MITLQIKTLETRAAASYGVCDTEFVTSCGVCDTEFVNISRDMYMTLIIYANKEDRNAPDTSSTSHEFVKSHRVRDIQFVMFV